MTQPTTIEERVELLEERVKYLEGTVTRIEKEILFKIGTPRVSWPRIQAIGKPLSDRRAPIIPIVEE